MRPGHQPSNPGGFVSFLTVLLFSGLVIISAVGFMLFVSKNPSQLPVASQSSPLPTASSSHQTYANADFNFTFDYPASWQVKEVSYKNEKLLHTILEINPVNYKAGIPAIKLLYADNPKELPLSDLEKTAAESGFTSPVFYAASDQYILSGSGLPVYFRKNADCGTKLPCQLYTFSKETRVYQLVSFQADNISDQDEAFGQIINSFGFPKVLLSPEPASTKSGLLK